MSTHNNSNKYKETAMQCYLHPLLCQQQNQYLSCNYCLHHIFLLRQLVELNV